MPNQVSYDLQYAVSVQKIGATNPSGYVTEATSKQLANDHTSFYLSLQSGASQALPMGGMVAGEVLALQASALGLEVAFDGANKGFKFTNLVLDGGTFASALISNTSNQQVDLQGLVVGG